MAPAPHLPALPAVLVGIVLLAGVGLADKQMVMGSAAQQILAAVVLVVTIVIQQALLAAVVVQGDMLKNLFHLPLRLIHTPLVQAVLAGAQGLTQAAMVGLG